MAILPPFLSFLAAMKLAKASGALVPMAVTVKPMTVSLILIKQPVFCAHSIIKNTKTINHNNDTAKEATKRHMLLPSLGGIVYLNSSTKGNKNICVANMQHRVSVDGGGDMSMLSSLCLPASLLFPALVPAPPSSSSKASWFCFLPPPPPPPAPPSVPSSWAGLCFLPSSSAINVLSSLNNWSTLQHGHVEPQQQADNTFGKHLLIFCQFNKAIVYKT